MSATTRPAPNDVPESATRIRTAPELVLAAVENGFDMATAVQLHAARAAESARLSQLWSA